MAKIKFTKNVIFNQAEDKKEYKIWQVVDEKEIPTAMYSSFAKVVNDKVKKTDDKTDDKTKKTDDKTKK